jgi:hypothetical protein
MAPGEPSCHMQPVLDQNAVWCMAIVRYFSLPFLLGQMNSQQLLIRTQPVVFPWWVVPVPFSLLIVAVSGRLRVQVQLAHIVWLFKASHRGFVPLGQLWFHVVLPAFAVLCSETGRRSFCPPHPLVTVCS